MKERHGLTDTPEYHSWVGMRGRCYNKNDRAYSRYGGRGIFVCKRWRESFLNFLQDMGPRPKGKRGIDRIDNDGPYSPENCRWASYSEQNSNTRVNRKITFNGVTKCASHWASDLGMRKEVFHARLKKWSVEEAITTPLGDEGPRMAESRINNASSRMIHYDKKNMCVAEWERESGIPREIIYDRLRHGWTPEEIFTTPPRKFTGKR